MKELLFGPLKRRIVRTLCSNPELLRLREENLSLRDRLSRLERQVFAKPYLNPSFHLSRGFNYEQMQMRFRGPADFTQQLLTFYVPYFRACDVVYDLGCGNGEFLQALKQDSIRGVGVDERKNAIERIQALGFEGHCSQLIAWVEQLPENSVSGFFSAQVIEHLDFNDVVRLFERCHSKLAVGGKVLFETVNPHCLYALKLFHLDPTHKQPLYPETLQLLAQSLGFKNCETIYPTTPEKLVDPYFDNGSFAILAVK